MVKLTYAKWNWCDDNGDPGLMYVQAIDSKKYNEDIILKHAFVGNNKTDWATRNGKSSNDNYTYMEHPFLSEWIESLGFQKISEKEFNDIWTMIMNYK